MYLIAFEYTSVPVGQGVIRILQLGPRATGVLERELKVVNKFDPPPHFKALSYAWGNSAHCTEILIQGKRFIIASLDTALRALQLEGEVRMI